MATLTYEYKVRDSSGSMKSGKLEAESEAMVATKLKSMGYAPVSITQANAGLSREFKIPGMGEQKITRELAEARSSTPEELRRLMGTVRVA